MLIVNADDWGRCKISTDRALLCYEKRRISSASAMAFMEDSARGAEVAKDVGIEVGLHINLSEMFTGPGVPKELRESQAKLCRFLSLSKYALILYNPFVRKQVAHVFRAQWEEFIRLFGKAPSHLDGHQHMHLCANMLLGQVMPRHCTVRRSFSFLSGEKSIANRWYRSVVDSWLLRRHRSTDYFFDLSTLCSTSAISRVTELAKRTNVELMAHPAREREFSFLLGEAYAAELVDVPIGTYSSI